MTRDQQIAEYNFLRNEVLHSGSVDAVMKFYAKYHPTEKPMNTATAEVAMHKARTACRQLPVKDRVDSWCWLNERGLHSLDDGELEKLAKEQACNNS